MHGPNVSNFVEIYKFLKKNNISTKVKNYKQLSSSLNNFFKNNTSSKKIQKKISIIGKKILEDTYKEITFITNEYEI